MSIMEIYSGKFHYGNGNDEYQGELQVDKANNIITLILTISSSDLSIIPSFPSYNEMEAIYGKLLSGKSVLLYRCYVVDGENRKSFVNAGLNYTTQVIRVSYLFETDIILGTEGLLLTSAQMDFGDILQWSNLCHYEWNRSGTSWNPFWVESEPITINVCDDLEVMFFPSRNSGIMADYREQIELKQKVYTKFQYKNPIKWDSFMEDIKRIEYLIGFGLQRKVHFEGINCQLLDNNSEGELMDSFGNNEVILGIGKIENIENQHPYFFLYNLPTITKKNHFSKWIGHYEMLKPILDLYFLILDSQYYLTSELVFLNLVQALETFHARFVTDDVKEYITRAKTLVVNYLHYEGWLNFLCDKGQRNSRSIYLKSRLADLMFADGQHLGTDAQYIQKIIDTRNYYTHYNPKKLEKSFTKSELPAVNYKLKLLLEFHIQRILGFEVEDLKKRYLDGIRRLR